MKYLITGRNGQLAQAFLQRFEQNGTDFIAPGESDLDITNTDRVLDLVNSSRPDVIINCAAYNLVDNAEREYGKAYKVNVSGPGILAYAARKNGCKLVHFSSDYVFDGMKKVGLYTEEDNPNPLNEYGKSKLLGEQMVRDEMDDYLILRLSWVFGDGRQNFIRKLLEWSKKNDSLKIASDEVSVPTCTRSVVDITMAALDRGVAGLYHAVNRGFCSRYEWAKTVLDCLGISNSVTPVPLDSFNLAAKRPRFSAMSSSRIAGLTGCAVPDWKEAVESFLRRKMPDV